MASVVSKRQQARNERALQDLIKAVPGNDKCADCAARNPGWASWSLGIFLCMRCAALHRKVGTHVTKVKSLSMDSWNNEQVESMKRIGNAKSNLSYNPRNVKPDIPIDVDEVDGVMERFIRQKYEQRAFSGGNGTQTIRQDTGSTSASSMEDQPPALPPKPGKRFGFSFRSSSSTYPQHQRMDKYTPPLSPSLSGSDGHSSPKQNKQSRVFGSKIGNGNQDDMFDSRLAALREMGFPDNRRNSTVLKSMNGNLDRTVETLVRLGSIGEVSKPPSRNLTPVSAVSASTSGLSVARTRPAEKAPEVPKSQDNPFDALDNVPPPRSVTAPLPQVQNAAPNQSWNPFQAQTTQDPSAMGLQTSFQSLYVSQPQQQMQMPSTNGYVDQNPFYANQQPQQQQQQQHYPQQYQQFQQTQDPSYLTGPQQAPQLGSTFDQSSNPFLRRAQSQTFTSTNPYAQQQQQSSAPNPWLQQQQPFAQTLQSQSSAAMYQQQPDFIASQPQQQQKMPSQSYAYPNGANDNPFTVQPQQPQYTRSATPTNPYQQAFIPQNQQQPQIQPQQQQPQQVMQQHQQQQQQPQEFMQQPPQQQYPPPQQPFRHDKSSILALYGQPHLAPSRPLQSLPEDPYAAPPPQPGSFSPSKRSATMPASSMGSTGNMNPFASASAGSAQSGGGQSPDAFTGLSARFVR